MNIKNRIKKLESLFGTSHGGFCRCGTSYFNLLRVIKPKGENQTERINEICNECGKNVKPETFGQFLERTKHLPIIVIKPKVQNEY